MIYKEIYKPLSRTSFRSKMKRAFYASIETMSTNGQVETDILRTKFLPDEIETFVLNCVVTKEYSEREMTDRQFIDVMFAIRNYQPPDYYQKLQTDQLRWILPTIGAVQFESQQYSFFRLYRHHCLFSFTNEIVDVDKAFKEQFERGFDDYTAIVYTFQMLLAKKILNAFSDCWGKINLSDPWFVDHLKMTREQYRDELSQYAKNSADYKYCLRPSYSYPFIEYEDEIFLPTPHLLIQSITTAMMNRLTFENPELREKIGKEACENYLTKIISESRLFDEVIPEYEYAKGKRTIDIMAKKGKTALLIDSKLFSPKVSLRTYDDNAYEKDVERIVKDMKQAYGHARFKFNKEYMPFSSVIEDIYALVVVYQEGYINLDEIYLQTAKALSINKDTSEFEWLCSHVGFTEVANIERFLLTGTDIIPEIINRENYSDKWLTGWNNAEVTDEVKSYQEKLMSDAEKIIEKLYIKNMDHPKQQ